MQIYVDDTVTLRSGSTRCPLRVNLRYEPDHARLTLRGALLARNTGDLCRLLDMLSSLPAPVRVTTGEVTVVDAESVALLADESARRARTHQPPLCVTPALRFVAAHPGAGATPIVD